MIRKINSVVHKFDRFSEPVANINMNGKSRYTTRVGGCFGLLIYSLLVWFVIVRIEKMMERREPVMYEVTQGMNLMAANSPSYNMQELNFNFGFGIYGTRVTSNRWNGK